MKVEIDTRSGFCFGVRNAVEIVEGHLNNGEKVYSLGTIVHNDKEVKRLNSLGLISIDHDEFKKLKNCNILIRAHGEPPETYLIAEKNNITIVEATCPIVKKLQLKIRNTWLNTKVTNGQVVIFGKPGHAEVIGLMGQTKNEAILVSGTADLEKIDLTKPVHLFAQTTMNIGEYSDIADLIMEKMKAIGISDPDKMVHVHNTICGQVSNRESHLKIFAEKHDVLVFVSGKESSNGKVLYSACKSVNPDTWFITSPDEIEKSWFKGKKSAGVCGATSTPKWLLEEVRDTILAF